MSDATLPRALPPRKKQAASNAHSAQNAALARGSDVRILQIFELFLDLIIDAQFVLKPRDLGL
jgi:hypothetical protein